MLDQGLRYIKAIGARVVLLVAPALMLMPLGCGSKPPVDNSRASVSGIVTFDGKPLPGANITFASVDSPIASAVSLGEGGRYASSRVPIGVNQVIIETDSLRYGSPHLHVPIPAKYADPSKSGLTADIKPGENENVNFDLKK